MSEVIKQLSRLLLSSGMRWRLRLRLGQIFQWVERMTGVKMRFTRGMLVSFSYLFRDVSDYEPRLSEAFAQQKKPLRILCVGCATGQEPYSVAIVCQDLGIPVTVVGIDLSSQAVETARAGLYDLEREKVRSLDVDTVAVADLIDRYSKYFEPIGANTGTQRIVKIIRDRVDFQVADICNMPFCDEFDFVICRKMLYYLPAQNRKLALVRMEAALKKNVSQNCILFDAYTRKQPFFKELVRGS